MAAGCDQTGFESGANSLSTRQTLAISARSSAGWNRNCTATPPINVRTARVRIALTDVKKSKWYLSLHPVSKLTGSGTGQATMEGELLDSVTGAQIAALVESQRGNQFELDTFSELDDARDAIDQWTIRFLVSLDDAHGR